MPEAEQDLLGAPLTKKPRRTRNSRKPMPGGETSVAICSKVASKARAVAAAKNVTVPMYLTSILEPAVDRDLVVILTDLKATPAP